MQYACAEAGIKIPCKSSKPRAEYHQLHALTHSLGGRVAEIMGPVFTEGAIVQHLAKLRGLMAKNGIPVPPALKRGMVTKSPSKVYAMANNKHKFPPIAPLHPGSPNIKTEGEEAKPVVENSNKATPKKEKKEKAKPKGKGKAKARGRTSSEDEDEDLIPDLYDTDEDFGIPAKATKKRRTNKQGKAKKTASKQQEPLALMPAEVPETDSQDNITIKVEEEEDFAGPATRTRGVKRNYSTMAADNSDEEQDFNENNEATAAAAAADGSSDHDMVDDAEGVDDEVDYDVDAQVDAEVDTDIDTDVDEEVGGNEYCSDQDTEIEDDEDSCASTEILEDAPTSRGMHIADTPYGQITMGPLNDPLGLYGTEDEVCTKILALTTEADMFEDFGLEQLRPLWCQSGQYLRSAERRRIGYGSQCPHECDYAWQPVLQRLWCCWSWLHLWCWRWLLWRSV